MACLGTTELLLLLLLLQGPQGSGACQRQPALKGVTRSTPAGNTRIVLLCVLLCEVFSCVFCAGYKLYHSLIHHFYESTICYRRKHGCKCEFGLLSKVSHAAPRT
jgi:hypothetical protein